MAPMEQTVVDQARGGFVRRDLAQYHIATCAGVQDVDAVWIDEQDPHHATGRRIRDLPITPAKLLG
jgi:xanthine dehydrogenase YagR molybdenum-binding subunit